MTGIQFIIVLWTFIGSIVLGIYVAHLHYKVYKGSIPLFLFYPLLFALLYLTIFALIVE